MGNFSETVVNRFDGCKVKNSLISLEVADSNFSMGLNFEFFKEAIADARIVFP